MPYHSFLLLDKKHSDRAGKYKRCTAEAEICYTDQTGEKPCIFPIFTV